MSGRTVRLERADADDLAYAEALLEGAGLPTDDVRDAPATFYVARVDDGAVGVGGLERHGTDGLLRSVVVEPGSRGEGLGTALVGSLEAAAAADGVRTLSLLTTDAAGFFAARGYAEVERSTVPAAVRGTAQFTDLCPATATCMRKTL